MGYLKCNYSVTSTTSPTKLSNFIQGYLDVLVDGVSQGKIKEYTFSTTGIHTAWFEYEIDKISDNTFINCPELEVIDIPDNIITIGYGAFQGCSNLNSVTHYNSIAIISPYAFAGCHLGYGFNLWVEEADGNGWGAVPNRFPNKVMFIENNVFEGCYFTDFALPDTIESIHSYAFANCPNLHTIYIGSGVTSIEANAFGSCSKLATVVCYSPTAPELDEHTFLDLYNYDGTLYYPVGSDYSSWMSANEYYLGYWDWNSVATNNIPNPDTGGCNTEPDEPIVPTSNNLICTYLVTSVSQFGTKICFDKTNFSDILYNGVSIGVDTLYHFQTTGEHTLEFVLVGDTINSEAFVDCKDLRTVVIPDSVTTIGSQAFYRCYTLYSAHIGSGVTTIGNDAFDGCDYLHSLTGGSGVTEIGAAAFNGCTNLESALTFNSVTSIGAGAFYGCEYLPSIEIGSECTTIGMNAFRDCTNLSEVRIGSGLTEIGDYAFDMCNALKTITITAPTAPTVQSWTFRGVAYDGTLYYPEGSDYSSWLSTDDFYLGAYRWNGIATDTPITGKIEPFTVNASVLPNAGNFNIRVGFENINEINVPTSDVSWFSLAGETTVDGTFIGYDTVKEYHITVQANENTVSRNGTVTFSGVDTNGNTITAVTNITQQPKEEEPEEPDIPEEDGVYYGPIWKDVMYTTGIDELYFRLTFNGNTIFEGKSNKAPLSNINSFYVNRLCENFMGSDEFPFDDGTVGFSYTMREFKLYGESGNLLYTYVFWYDWSYSPSKTGVLTNPILPYIGDGQKLFFTTRAIGTSYTIPYSIVYRDGSRYNNNMYVNNEVFTDIVTESRSENVSKYIIDGNTYNYLPLCKCRYVIYYLASDGGWNWLPITGKVNRKKTITPYNTLKNYNNSTSEFGRRRYMVDVEERFSCYTGWLTQEQANRMSEIYESNVTYIHDLVEDKIIPVLCEDSEFEYKQQRWTKMLSYNMNFISSQIKKKL